MDVVGEDYIEVHQRVSCDRWQERWDDLDSYQDGHVEVHSYRDPLDGLEDQDHVELADLEGDRVGLLVVGVA